MKSKRKDHKNLIKASVIGEKIKMARKNIGMTQKDLAKALELTDKAISSYEVGRSIPSLLILREICEITYKPMSYFSEEHTQDIDIQIRLKKVEKELLEIKKLLQK